MSQGLPEGEEDLRRAQEQLDLLFPAPIAAAPSLSLIDRFQTLLDVGRRLAAALTEVEVYSLTHEAALQLLRGMTCVVLEVSQEQLIRRAGLARSYSESLVATCLEKLVAIPLSADGENSSESLYASDIRSALAVPILVHGEARAVVYLEHEASGLLGKDTLSLADFIATVAGAALENAQAFRERALVLAHTQAREELLSALFHSVDTGLALLNRQGIVIRHNPYLGRMVGEEDLLGREVLNLLEPSERTKVEPRLQSLARGELAHAALETRVVRPQGGVSWVQVALSRVESAAEDSAIICAFTDISHQRVPQIMQFQENLRSRLSTWKSSCWR